MVVDDEETLCEILQYNLEAAGYEVATAHSAEEAVERRIDTFDLVLLDVMMEDERSGFELAQRIRNHPATARTPIIFCTARDGEEDVLTGLGLGADDYIRKPFSVREAVARVHSVLDRSRTEPARQVAYEGLRIDLDRKSCTVDGNEITLTKKELEILALLIQYTERIFSREEILARVWSEDVIVLDRTIDVNIARIRRKIGPYGSHIVTRAGYGYGFFDVCAKADTGIDPVYTTPRNDENEG